METAKEKLLEIFSPEELEAEIEKRLSEGARSEHSALNKILRENAEQLVETLDVKGLFVTSYVRSRDEQMCIVLATETGLVRISADMDISTIDRWNPVKVKEVALMKNIRTGSTWYQATEDTEVSVDHTSQLDMFDVLQGPKDIDGGGMYLIMGAVEFVNRTVKEFDEATMTPISHYPVIDDDKVNMKLVIKQDGSRANVAIPDIATLKSLLEVEDVSWVERDFDEAADMLAGMTIIVLGGGNNEVGGKTVTPFIQPKNFGFIERWA